MSLIAHIPRAHPARTALFVCDMQERFKTAIFKFDHVTSTGVKLLKAAKILDLPSYATEQNPRALGPTIEPLSSLIPKESPVVPKTRFSMVLSDGSTQQWLSKSGRGGQAIDGVVIFGIESHVCVLQTTLDLLASGINVFVPADGVSSCNPAEVPLALARMRQAGATITTSESILFELMSDASEPNFKAFSGLIKNEKENTKDTLRALLESSGQAHVSSADVSDGDILDQKPTQSAKF